MLFTSIEFAFFLGTVFLVYWLWLGKNVRRQNLFLLAAGYFFYGWWSWKLLFLLVSVSCVNYQAGLLMAATLEKRTRKLILIAGLILDLGTLVIFKYFNFFIREHLSALKIVLPVGISFYVFLSISYLVDVYRRKVEAERNLVEVLLSLSFFPVIMSGPLERPVSLLPQIREPRVFDYALATDGVRQFVWGLLMKMVVANNCAVFADQVFGNSGAMPGGTLLLGAVFYAIQIYADFSGYSDMAIGVGKLLGFRIMRNFAFPYFAGNISEYWRRWNISLTNWFRDYVFLPVAYFISGKIRSDRFLLVKTDLFIYVVAIGITWSLTGLWHGANYTFIAWGLLHGLMLIVFHITRKPKQRLLRKLPAVPGFFLRGLEYVIMMIVVVVAWVFFRSASLHQAADILARIADFSRPLRFGQLPGKELTAICLAAFGFEFIQRKKEFPLRIGTHIPWMVRWAAYYLVVLVIVFFGGGQQEFLYFKF